MRDAPSEFPPLPKFELTKYQDRQRRIKTLLSPLLGKKIQMGDIQTIATRIAVSMKIRSKAVSITLLSLQPTKPFNEAHLRQWATRLCGNMDTLKKGRAIEPWRGQDLATWEISQIRDLDDHITRKGRKGYLVTMRFLTGIIAGEEDKMFLSSNFCFHVAKSLGLSSKARKIDNPRQLVGGLAFTYVMNGFMAEKVKIARFSASSSVIKFNQKLYDARDTERRFEHKTVCPRGLTITCHSCPSGFGDRQPEQCHLATREVSMKLGVCACCKKLKVVRTYGNRHNLVCVQCHLSAQRKRSKGS